MALNLLFPIALALGRVFHIDQDRIKSSFIEVNNQLVRSKEFKLLPAQILVLAPHCLQWSGCPHKITVNIDNAAAAEVSCKQTAGFEGQVTASM